MSIILLDIGNVIVSVDFLPFCRTVARNAGSGEHEMFRRYCEGDLKNRFDKGGIAPYEYLHLIARDPFARKMPLHQLKAAWQNIFSLKEGCSEAVPLLKRHHTVWIMSDTDPLHFTFLLNNYAVLRGIECYYLSYEHGTLKSSVDAFNHVLDSSGCLPGDFLLIDDRKENCAACEKAGMGSLLFLSWPETLATLGLQHASDRETEQFSSCSG
jgi:FMN phosphatase YigB (HAD superfamily)